MDISHPRDGRADPTATRAQDRIRSLLGAPGSMPVEPLDPPSPSLDVRDFLLDPPPTPEQIERDARRRTLVRRGSVAAAVLVGIVLVMPLPGGGDAPAPQPQADDAAVAAATPAAQEAGSRAAASPSLPRRIDAPAPRRPRPRADASARRVPPRAPSSATATPVPTVRVPARAATPTPQRSQAPSKPIAEPSPTDGVLVPLG
jgi:hypothetical protein